MFSILVCVKQVLDPEGPLPISPEGDRVLPGPRADYRMNLYDAHALEEALRMREAFGPMRIDVLSAGPERAALVLRRAMGMGADQGIHLMTALEEEPSQKTLAFWIAQVCRERGYDLILTGVMSEDRMCGMVGPMLAHYLSLPYLTCVTEMTPFPEARRVSVLRELEGGHTDAFEIRLPALLTIHTGPHTPRYPSLSRMLAAKGAALEKIDTRTLLVPGPPEVEERITHPEKERAGRLLQGDPAQKAGELVKILESCALLS